MTARETYERIAQLINGTTRESNGFAVKVNEEYAISVLIMIRGKENKPSISAALVRHMGPNGEIIAKETIKVGASDKVIMNKWNKLIALV